MCFTKFLGSNDIYYHEPTGNIWISKARGSAIAITFELHFVMWVCNQVVGTHLNFLSFLLLYNIFPWKCVGINLCFFRRSFVHMQVHVILFNQRGCPAFLLRLKMCHNSFSNIFAGGKCRVI